MRSRIKKAGFSLLEVLIAMLILAVVMLSVLPALGRSFQSHRLSQQRWKAAVEAWNRAERFRVLSDPAAERLAMVPGAKEVGRIVVGNPRFGIRWEVLHGQD